MKAVFPCKGVIVVTKNNVNKISDFYMDNLANSKLFDIYKQSNYSTQVGSFNYLPKKSTIYLDKVHFLTLSKLHSVLAEKIENSPLQNTDTPLDDNFILNHPFFKTLTPLN